jgi:hypothetical protein
MRESVQQHKEADYIGKQPPQGRDHRSIRVLEQLAGLWANCAARSCQSDLGRVGGEVQETATS